MSELKSVLFIAWLMHIFKTLLFLTSHEKYDERNTQKTHRQEDQGFSLNLSLRTPRSIYRLTN